MKKSAPEAPDPYKTASAQLDMNALDRSGPFGKATWQRDASGRPIGQSVSLAPGLQGAADTLMSRAGTAAGFLPTSRFSLDSIPGTDAISKTFFDKGAALLKDPFGQAKQDLDIRLSERGLPIGSEARNIAEGNLQRQQSLAMSDLASNASLLAPQEQDRLIRNKLMERNQGAFDLSSILQGMQGLPVPDFAPQPQADLAGLVGQNYAMKSKEASDYNSGLGSLLGAGAGLFFSPLPAAGLAGTVGGSLMGW